MSINKEMSKNIENFLKLDLKVADFLFYKTDCYEYKIYNYIYRKTVGWLIDEIEISISNLASKLEGFSRPTLQKTLKSLENKKLIKSRKGTDYGPKIYTLTLKMLEDFVNSFQEQVIEKCKDETTKENLKKDKIKSLNISSDNKIENKKTDKQEFIEILTNHSVESDLIEEYVKYRKSMKVQITARSARYLIAEATKANLTVSAAIETVMNNSWKGFKAEYVSNSRANNKYKQNYVKRDKKTTDQIIRDSSNNPFGIFNIFGDDTNNNINNNFSSENEINSNSVNEDVLELFHKK